MKAAIAGDGTPSIAANDLVGRAEGRRSARERPAQARVAEHTHSAADAASLVTWAV
jgi:hypothetical protein